MQNNIKFNFEKLVQNDEAYAIKELNNFFRIAYSTIKPLINFYTYAGLEFGDFNHFIIYNFFYYYDLLNKKQIDRRYMVYSFKRNVYQYCMKSIRRSELNKELINSVCDSIDNYKDFQCIADNKQNIHEQTIYEEKLKLIFECLSPIQKRIFNFYLKGYSVCEISNKLKIKERSVRYQLKLISENSKARSIYHNY